MILAELIVITMFLVISMRARHDYNKPKKE